MGDIDPEEKNISDICGFYDGYSSYLDNISLNALFDGHPIINFVIIDNDTIYIECGCGKKANLTNREIYNKFCEIKEIIERKSFGDCKEGDNHKKFEYYSEELKKNLCDLCLSEYNLDPQNLFNFDNHLYDYVIWGNEIIVKFKADENSINIIPSKIKESFNLIWEIFTINHHDYSIFTIIKGYHNFCLRLNSNESN